jgi:23S rRNA-/tRNA-specific pseudouridylate synthase
VVSLSRSHRTKRAQIRSGRQGRRSRDLDVVYEDDAIVVVNKPPGLLSVPLERNPAAPSVFDQLVARYRPHGKQRPFVVHRIDQDTSGLVVFAKDPTSQQRLKAQFAQSSPAASPQMPLWLQRAEASVPNRLSEANTSTPRTRREPRVACEGSNAIQP